MGSVSLHYVLFFSGNSLQVGNLTEVLIPYVKYRMSLSADSSAAQRAGGEGEGAAAAAASPTRVQRSQAEKGRHLEHYDRERLRVVFFFDRSILCCRVVYHRLVQV